MTPMNRLIQEPSCNRMSINLDVCAVFYRKKQHNDRQRRVFSINKRIRQGRNLSRTIDETSTKFGENRNRKQ